MDKQNIKVSVIIPVYNVEPYIRKCLDSLQAQTLRDLEFIFVDDRSPDGSLAIIESAAQDDPRIQIVHNEENIGPGPSRNRGIEAARGEYLSFVDPDDYMDDNYYEILYALAEERHADVVKAHVTAVDTDGKVVDAWHDGNRLFRDRAALSHPLFFCDVMEHFSHLFKRTFITDDPTLRYTDTKVGEDSVFLLKVCLKDPSFFLCDDVEYYHLMRKDSLIGRVSFDKALEGMKALANRIDVLSEYGFPRGTEIYLRKSVEYYILEFLNYDRSQTDTSLRDSQRRLFKEKLDGTLSALPDPRSITDQHKLYMQLTKMTEDNQGFAAGTGKKQCARKPNLMRKLARKILPEKLRKKLRHR